MKLSSDPASELIPSGRLGNAQEGSENLSGTWDSLGEIKRAPESSGELRRAQELREFKRAQKGARELGRAQRGPGVLRRV